MTRTWSKYH